MIGLQHAVVSDLLEHARHLQHVEVAVVDERLAEVEKPSLMLRKWTL